MKGHNARSLHQPNRDLDDYISFFFSVLFFTVLCYRSSLLSPAGRLRRRTLYALTTHRGQSRCAGSPG